MYLCKFCSLHLFDSLFNAFLIGWNSGYFTITSQYFYNLTSAINVIIFCNSLFYFTGQEELDCLEDCPYKTLSTNKSSALWVRINITVIWFGASLSRKKKL